MPGQALHRTEAHNSLMRCDIQASGSKICSVDALKSHAPLGETPEMSWEWDSFMDEDPLCCRLGGETVPTSLLWAASDPGAGSRTIALQALVVVCGTGVFELVDI